MIHIVYRLVRMVMLVSILTFIYPVMTHCQDTVVQVTVNEDDAREITGYLRELKSTRKQVDALQSLIDRQDKLADQEKKLADDKLAFANSQRDFYKAESDKYAEQLKQLTKGGGFGCVMKKIVTIGIARCH